jgi:hypothetical protein
MNLIIENNTNLVLIASDADVSLIDGQYALGGTKCGYSTNSVYITENATLPQFYFDGCYSYVNGVWTIVDQQIYDANYQQAYNAAAKPIIEKRDGLLYASDWTQIPNNPLTPTQQQAWAIYRQELRDVTKQADYPWSVTWPTAPAVSSSTQSESSGL